MSSPKAMPADVAGMLAGEAARDTRPQGAIDRPRRVSAVVLSGALLAILPFVLFWRIWWPDPAARRALAYGDFTEQYYPMRAFVAYELRHARLPLWDPFTYAGQPAAGASLYAPFYPPGLWETLFPDPLPFEVLEIEALLHLSLAGVGTLLFVRRLTGRTGAGVVAGLAFGLGGFLTSYPVLQLLILETAAWLPLVLWLLELSLSRRSPFHALLAGAALGCALLAGHPQTFMYAGYLAAAFFAMRSWHYRVRLPVALVLAALAGGFAAALSAVQWLPTLELSRLSPRAHLTYEEVAHGFALPDVWGLVRANPGQWSPLYVGLIPLALAVLALAVRRRLEVWFWALVAGAALLLSFGGNAFLYPLAYGWLPGFAMFRNQERAAFLVSFALAVLAGYGFAEVWERVLAKNLEHEQREGSKAYRARRMAAAISFIAVGLIFADLYRANAGAILAQAPPGGYFAKTPAVAQVQAVSLPGWRMSSEGLLPGDGNGGLVFRVRDVAGNSPLHLQNYEEFLNIVPELRWWQLLNVQHILTARPLNHGALKLVRQDGNLRLYQVFVQGVPAWISHAYQAAADQAGAIRATAAPGLDPRTTTVLEGRPGMEPVPSGGGRPEQVSLAVFEPAYLAFDADLTAPGLVVFSEIAYPGWNAYVRPRAAGGQGRSWPGLRAFGLLRAVALPAGEWRIVWRYEPVSVRLGGLLSILSATTLVVLSIYLRKSHRL